MRCSTPCRDSEEVSLPVAGFKPCHAETIAMKSISLRLPEPLIDALDEEADEEGVARSEYIREALRARHEADEIREELEQELDAKDAEVADLQRQLASANQRIDAANELVEYVEHERTLAERRERREERRATAGLLTRTKWYFFGMSGDEENV